jgi:hypothetical protein
MMFKHIIEHVIPGRSNVHIGKFRDKGSPWAGEGVQIQRRKGLSERTNNGWCGTHDGNEKVDAKKTTKNMSKSSDKS